MTVSVSVCVCRLQSRLAQVQLSAMSSLRSWLTGMENRISLTAPLGPDVSALPAQVAEHASLSAEVARWKPHVTELFDVLVVEEDGEDSGKLRPETPCDAAVCVCGSCRGVVLSGGSSSVSGVAVCP